MELGVTDLEALHPCVTCSLGQLQSGQLSFMKLVFTEKEHQE